MVIVSSKIYIEYINKRYISAIFIYTNVRIFYELYQKTHYCRKNSSFVKVFTQYFVFFLIPPYKIRYVLKLLTSLAQVKFRPGSNRLIPISRGRVIIYCHATDVSRNCR